ncbi:MAG: iron ABC transporter permease [Actinomycetota bacterium]
MSSIANSTLPPGPVELLARRAQAAARRNGTTIVVGLALAALVVPPIFTVVYSSFVSGSDVWHGTRTVSHYRHVFGQGTSLEAIKNTFIFAAGSALLAVAIASIVAFFVERTNAPLRRFVYFTVIVALGVPILVETMGWVLLLGPNNGLINSWIRDIFGFNAAQINIYSMFWMVFIQATITFPAVFLLVAPAFRLADPSLEQAAAVSGASQVRILRTVTFPLVRPSLVAALLLSFIVGIESFEVPALLGTPSHIKVLSTAIYFEISNAVEPDFGAAAVYATLLMVLTIVGLWAYQRATARAHRFVTVTGKGFRPQTIQLGKYRWLTALITVLVPLLILAPILILFWASFLQYYAPPSRGELKFMSLSNYHAVLHAPGFTDALKNTFILGAGAAVLVMGLGLVAAWGVLRRPSSLSRGVDYLGSLPLVVPGVVLSLAVVRVFINFPIGIYDTTWIILLALVIHYLPWGLRFNHAGLITQHRELEEAADVSGANRLAVFLRIVVPLMRPTLVAGGLFVFMATLRQLALVIFLAGPNLNVVSSWIWAIWNNANLAQASTAAMIVTVPVLIVAAIFYKVTGAGESATFGGR